jgi:GTP pyrophosphokinase
MKIPAVQIPPSTLGQASAQPTLPQVLAATAGALAESADALARARSFAEPLIAHEALDSGESMMAHADAVAAILRSIGGSQAMQAASYLVYAGEHLNHPLEVITKAFGESFASLAVETAKLVRVQRLSREAQSDAQLVDDPKLQTENVRKMLLAFSRDLRVVMLRLASRLQTLRYHAASRQTVSPVLARESLQVFAPLANRLGIWQIKWEMEDLAFRFLEPANVPAGGAPARRKARRTRERCGAIAGGLGRRTASGRAFALRCRGGRSTFTASCKQDARQVAGL